MTWLLASGLIGALALIGTLAVLLYKAQRETMHARDALLDQKALSAEYKSGRDVEVAEHAVTSAELKETRERLSAAEADRNAAYREARDHFVERIKNSPDGADLVSDLLAAPWPTVHGVSPHEPKTSHPAPGRDDLIDPDL